MIRITRAQIQPVGVDMGVDSVKLIQLEASNGQLSVVAAQRQALPVDVRRNPGDHLAAATDAMQRMLRSGGFIGRHVVASLPRELVQVKNLRLPHMPPADLEQAVQFEARSIFPFDTDDAQIRFLHAGEVRQGNDAREEVIVLAVKNQDVNSFIEQLHHCGVVVESVDFEPCAIYRGVERFVRRREDEHEVHVLIDIGSRRSQVVIGKGREISFLKPIDIGGQHLHEAVVRKLGITSDEARALRLRLIESAIEGDEATKRDPVRQAVSDATRSIIEDLAREISLCLRYYSVTFRGHRPNRIRLIGGEASDTHVQAILTSSLPLPVEAVSPLQGIDVSRMKPSDRRGNLCEWGVAFGLGLKKTTGHFGNRHGKRRDIRCVFEEQRPAAEVIDLSRAVQGTAPTAEPAATPPRRPQEVARA